MLFENSLAANHPRCISGACKVKNLVTRTLRIARNTSRTGLQHAEITHAPLGRITADEHHAITRLDAFAGKKSSRARRQFTQVSIRVLLLTPVAFDPHRDSRLVTLGRRLKELEQIAIGVDALRLCAHLVFERWEDPFGESG